MKYLSTRNSYLRESFSTIVLKGLSEEGGLFVPERFPDIFANLKPSMSYFEVAERVFDVFMSPDFGRKKINQLVKTSYRSFDSNQITPLEKYGDFNVLELFHGPTFAFKDIALQFLGNLLRQILNEKEIEVTILGATSGDTGGAAIAGLAGLERCKVVMLFPKGRVSPIQELQMCAGVPENIFPIAMEGSFDDAQTIVKQLFCDESLRSCLHLTAVNSINFCRIMAQMVYYFFSYFKTENTEHLSYSIPTGNFGDALAGYYAHRCGLPVKKFIIGCNENDILSRVFQTGIYRPEKSMLTLSPAMDIQLSSNFERLLFELTDRDCDYQKRMMTDLEKNGFFVVEPKVLEKLHSKFEVHRVTNQETGDMMRRMAAIGRQVDPHTAVGMVATEKSLEENVICLSTAHPIKFAETFESETAIKLSIPDRIATLSKAKRRCFNVSNDVDEVRSFLLQKV